MGCIICGGQGVKLHGQPRYEPKIRQLMPEKKFQVVSCRNCGFVFLEPNINTIIKYTDNLYDTDYFVKGLTRWWERKRIEQRNERFQRMEQITGFKREAFLDIGCGEGDMLNAASERYPFVYGQDIFNNMGVDRIKIPKENLFIGQLKDAKYKDDMFSAIHLDSVLEHVLDPVELLSEIKRILSPGGCAYINVPNEFSFDNFVKGIAYRLLKPGISPKIDPFRNPYHVIGFSKKAFRLLINKCGLKIKYFRTFAGTYEFKKYHIISSSFWKTFIFWPVYAAGVLSNNAFYMEAYLTKE